MEMLLRAEVEQFIRWANERVNPDLDVSKSIHRSREWECDYPNWPDVYKAVEKVIANRNEFSECELRDLLFLLARDNEDERIMDTLSGSPAALFALCDAPEEFKEADSKWQLAVALGRIGDKEATLRLIRLTNDSEEYVRRRARFAIENLKIPAPMKRQKRIPVTTIG